MNYIKRNIPYITIFCLLGIILSISSCVEALKSSQRNRSKRAIYERQRLETYKRPEVKPEVLSEDGMKFESEHYILTFSEDIKKAPKFDSAQGRISRGLGDLIFMEGQYNFVKKIFGFEAKDKIKVIVHRILRDSIKDAYTSMSRGVKVVDGKFQAVYDIEVHFSLDAFKSRSIQAHELTHAFTQVYALPAWLAEGIAVLVESEYASGAHWAKAKRNLAPIGFDENGVNIIQNWRGHGSTLPDRSVETYAYAYSIVSELRKKYGEDFYQKFFVLLDKDGIHYKAGVLSSSVIVYYMSQAAGEDLVPFFQQLKFNVRKLERKDILTILAD